MTVFVALLHAVNVGGTGKLPMTKLVELCERAGFAEVRTYIASGNAIFDAHSPEAKVKADLEAVLKSHAGSPIAVAVREAGELAAVHRRNPFPDAPQNWVTVVFLDTPTSAATLEGVTGQAADEELVLGPREIYVRYGSGVGQSKLRLPRAARGTARNMNTVAKLAAMAAGS
jgi:uncharacterized protein (DUF1697 family)